MKKILMISLFMLSLLFIGCDFKPLYEVEQIQNGYKIVNYTGTESSVIAPNLFDGKNINTIGENCYAYNIYIESVVINYEIVRIDTCAFWYCTELKTVYISKDCLEIAPFAFYQCYSIQDVYYEGTEEQFYDLFEAEMDDAAINSNRWLVEANLHFNVNLSNGD